MSLDSPAYEALCQRCGISCRAAVPFQGRLIVLRGLHCPFLVPTELTMWGCSVYEERFQKAPWCLHTKVAGPIGILRDGCPYAPETPGKVMLSSEEYRRLWPQLGKALLSHGAVNPHFTWSKFFRAAEKLDPGYQWFLETSPAGNSARVRRRKKGWIRKLFGR